MSVVFSSRQPSECEERREDVRDEINTRERRGCVADVVDVEAHAQNLRGDELEKLDKAAVRR